MTRSLRRRPRPAPARPLPRRAVLAVVAALGLLLVPIVADAAEGGPARKALLDGYAAEAGAAPSVDRGRAFFTGTHGGGKPDIPSCTTCHGTDLRAPGKTRAGKVVEPMAVSANPKRLIDRAEAEKWFGRNCDAVLGRACTAAEKADIVAFLSSL